MRGHLVLLAACATPAPAPIAHHIAPLPAPTSPAPTVAFVDNRIITTGLPAVSADGTAILFADQQSDMARGNPSLSLHLRDRDDRAIAIHPVLGFDDADDPAPHFTEANRWLATRHAALNFVPMRPLDVTNVDPAAFHHRAQADGITLDWQPSLLTISRGGAAPFTHATPSTWLVADRPLYANSTELCSNPAFLAGASVDTDRAVAVLIVAYMGSDTCWEPPSQTHVVHW